MGERFAILCATRTTPAAARVAHALTRHGAEVCMVAPPDSFAALTRFKVADILLPPEEMAQRMPVIMGVLAEEFRAHSVLVSDDFCFSALTDLLRRPDEARLSPEAAAMLERSMPPLNIARARRRFRLHRVATWNGERPPAHCGQSFTTGSAPVRLADRLSRHGEAQRLRRRIGHYPL